MPARVFRLTRLGRLPKRTGDLPMTSLSCGRADVLHVNFYELSRWLDAEAIGEDLVNMVELLNQSQGEMRI